MSEITIMLGAGGTGGHLFPAYALAEELSRRGVAVDLMTDGRGDRFGAGFPARRTFKVPAATVSGKSPAAMLAAGWTMSRGIRAAHRILGEVRPAAVVGFGGYPSFPPLIAAVLRGIPTALHEQNAVLGRANRVLARRVSAIATSFERVRYLDGALAAKARLTGNPVREIVRRAAARPYAPPRPGSTFHLLVFGGSQGARFTSTIVPPALAMLGEEHRRSLSVVQQCRPEDLEQVRAHYADAGIDAELAPFFADLPDRIAGAHLVIGRSGASTIAELAAIGRPSILVPLPGALDNDQLRNATTLAESGGAWCIEQKDLTAQRLSRELDALMGDPGRLVAAAAAARACGRPDAVERLADLAQELAGTVPRTAARETAAG